MSVKCHRGAGYDPGRWHQWPRCLRLTSQSLCCTDNGLSISNKVRCVVCHVFGRRTVVKEFCINIRNISRSLRLIFSSVGLNAYRHWEDRKQADPRQMLTLSHSWGWICSSKEFSLVNTAPTSVKTPALSTSEVGRKSIVANELVFWYFWY